MTSAQPGHNQPGHNQPGHDQPGHNQPGHDQPGHAHGGHAHAPGADADPRRLGIALGLIVAFMLVEVVAGVAAHSLALLSDSAHMLTDAGALALALAAARLAKRPPKGRMTFGLRRVEILSALLNASLLAVLAVFVVWQAVLRLITVPHVHGGAVLVVALAGIGVNLLASWQLARASQVSLNVRASYAHILTDLYAFVATALAAGAILLTGYQRADALASLVVAALMLHASVHLLREAVHVLMEGAPEGMDVTEIGESLAAHACVTNVHDLHVWEITSGFPALSAHVLVRPDDDCHAVREELEHLLEDRFHISHTTLQVDHDQAGRILTIEPRPPHRDPRGH